MALQIGTPAATGGMAAAIFDEVDTQLSPPLEKAVEEASDAARPGAQAALDAAREGWRKLAFAVATGVVEHLLDSLEVVGVRTGGAVSAPVVNHVAVQSGVVFVQTNDGPGRVR
jgi:hypothetical protein